MVWVARCALWRGVGGIVSGLGVGMCCELLCVVGVRRCVLCCCAQGRLPSHPSSDAQISVHKSAYLVLGSNIAFFSL